MKEIKLKMKYHDPQNVTGYVEIDGIVIDTHVHSSESWLLDDWGFFGKSVMGHDEKLMKHIKEPFVLVYNSSQNYDFKEFRRELPAPSERG